MSRHLGLDERVQSTSLASAQTTYRLAGGYRDGIYGNGNGNGMKAGRNDAPKHRRVISASDISLKRLRDGQLLEKAQSREDSPLPDLFLGEPLQDMGEAERRTLQTQWTDALKKIQSLHRGTQSERWSGVATDIFRPKSLTTEDESEHEYGATSLDHWNYYPGPNSVNRDSIPQRQLGNTIRENKNVRAAGAWNTTSNMLKGRGARSITTFEKLDPSSLEATQSIIGEPVNMTTESGRASTGYRAADYRPPTSGFGSTAPSLDQYDELPSSNPKSYAAVARAQSQRYGRIWTQKPEANRAGDMRDASNSEVYHLNAEIPCTPVLKKSISMREGGAHADAVREMARAYADTVCGATKTLECASCGRNLGIVVQGNPGVDMAFCQACRPSPVQWRKSVSVDSKKKKNGIIRFCRKILRLDKKSS